MIGWLLSKALICMARRTQVGCRLVVKTRSQHIGRGLRSHDAHLNPGVTTIALSAKRS
ncbi:protein of unknown function [Agreia sp. COWG]|nr:protein of unknown function [Agreia sp. COWG]